MTSWIERDFGEFENLSGDRAIFRRVFTDSRNGRIFVHRDGETWHADGPTGNVSSGESWQTVVQAALDRANAIGAGNVVLQADTVVGINGSVNLTTDTGLVASGPSQQYAGGWQIQLEEGADSDMITTESGATSVEVGNLTLNGDYPDQSAGTAIINSEARGAYIHDNFMRWGFNHGVRVGNRSLVFRNFMFGVQGNGYQVDAPDCHFVANEATVEGTGLQINTQNTKVFGGSFFLCGLDGVSVGGNYNKFSDIRANDNDQNGVKIESGTEGTSAMGVYGIDNGQDSGANSLQRCGFRVIGNEHSLTGCHGVDTQSTATQVYGAFVSGDGNVITGGRYTGNQNADIRIAGGSRNVIAGATCGSIDVDSGATETVVSGVPVSSVTDDGTRTVLNGFGTNAGDPSSAGDWNTHSDTAYYLGATIIDTSTEGDLYAPLPPSATSNWVRVGGTAV